MPSFNVRGVDKTTGKDEYITVNAKSAEEAQKIANQKGILVEQVTPIVPANPEAQSGWFDHLLPKWDERLARQKAQAKNDEKIENDPHLSMVNNIEHHTRSIAFWVRLWSVLILIAMGIALLPVLLMLAALITHQY